MDLTKNRYSSQYDVPNVNGFAKKREWTVVGEPLAADWVDLGFGIGYVFKSEQEAKRELQDAISAFERDIRELKRGNFQSIYGQTVVDKSEQLEIIAEYTEVYNKLKKWKIAPIFGG